MTTRLPSLSGTPRGGPGTGVINMTNAMITLAQNDPEVIANMKLIIDKQQYDLDKKTKLLLGIQHNVNYLSELHTQN